MSRDVFGRETDPNHPDAGFLENSTGRPAWLERQHASLSRTPEEQAARTVVASERASTAKAWLGIAPLAAHYTQARWRATPAGEDEEC